MADGGDSLSWASVGPPAPVRSSACMPTLRSRWRGPGYALGERIVAECAPLYPGGVLLRLTAETQVALIEWAEGARRVRDLQVTAARRG